MLGSTLALVAASLFALNAAFARRGTVRVADPSSGVFISVFLALPFFAAILAALGKLPAVAWLTWQSYLLLAGAGITNFVLGRTLNYASVRLIGANIGTVLFATNPLYAVTLGVLVLGEALTWSTALGALLVVAGAALVAWNPGANRRPHPATRRGILLALGAGVLYGIGPFLAKAGLEGAHPMAGAFVSYAAAAALLGFSLPWKLGQPGFRSLDQPAFLWFILAGLAVALAHAARFLALSLSPVSTVAPLSSAGPIFILAFSFFFNRRLEVFSPAIVAGAGVVVLGAVLLF